MRYTQPEGTLQGIGLKDAPGRQSADAGDGQQVNYGVRDSPTTESATSNAPSSPVSHWK
jgi:hypothetical protein